MTKQIKQTALAIIILMMPAILFAQFSVSGTVTDANNIPVAGASIRLQNSAAGVSTDQAGKFSLNIPGSSGTIEVSSIGPAIRIPVQQNFQAILFPTQQFPLADCLFLM